MTRHINPHSLRLPAWGPYTKRYAGISHVPDERLGMRFDLSVFPGVYRHKLDVPNVMWESGFHPWEAAADLSYFSHRHELVWKDQVYCDVAFAEEDAQGRLIACTLVNRTETPQQLVLHYMASLHFPPIRPYSQEWLRPTAVTLPAGAVWVEALDYAAMRFAAFRTGDYLVYEGWYRGEVRGHGFVDGRGLGLSFGSTAGDVASYAVTLAAAIPDAVLLFRYRAQAGRPARFTLAGLAEGEVTLAGEGDLTKASYQFAGDGPFSICALPVGTLAAGTHTLTLTGMGAGAVELDGFALVTAGQADAVTFTPVHWQPVPSIEPGPTATSLMLTYPDLPESYGIAWGHDLATVREFYTDQLDHLLRATVHNHTATRFTGEGEGHYTNVFMRPVFLAPGETKTIYGLVCCGAPDAVRARLAAFDAAAPAWPARLAAARARAIDTAPTPAGQPYRFSQERMAATLLTNVVYPVITRGSYITHHTPGRIWDCLYTWDSGFIGLGLAALDPRRATDCLNAYLTDPGDPHAAFLHHGTPLPVQAYLFQELWNQTGDRALLAHVYPRLQQFHAFLCGNAEGSRTRTLASNLLRTWDYFYNSGGWDDYPPQVQVHQHGLEASVAPIVNTAHAIRTAKILRMAALALGKSADVAAYEADVALFTEALQQHAWDETAGYFGYVCHDEAGLPNGLLRHESGANFNMGLDGVSPLIAGVCTPAQEARLLGHLSDPARLLTPIGLSTVDQSAPYFRVDGYWNGAVWMPHQWFIWKALLDLGALDLAFDLAHRGLDVWRREVDETYHCFEHFITSTGRGAGWHQFGGLSAPVLAWYSAYYRPGRLTCGLDTWVKEITVAPEQTALEARLSLHGRPERQPGVIVCLRPGGSFTATWDGQAIPAAEVLPGVLHLRLPLGHGEGLLRVSA